MAARLEGEGGRRAGDEEAKGPELLNLEPIDLRARVRVRVRGEGEGEG